MIEQPRHDIAISRGEKERDRESRGGGGQGEKENRAAHTVDPATRAEMYQTDYC